MITSWGKCLDWIDWWKNIIEDVVLGVAESLSGDFESWFDVLDGKPAEGDWLVVESDGVVEVDKVNQNEVVFVATDDLTIYSSTLP